MRTRRFPRSTRPLKLEISKSVIRDFRRVARSAFPNEVLAYLLGHDLGHTIIIESLWVPDNQVAAQRWVTVAEHYDWEAAQLAIEDDLQVVGDIHTHPMTAKDMNRLRVLGMAAQDLAPSDTDWDARGACRWITGICSVDETKTGALKTAMRFWGPVQSVVLEQT